MKSRGRNEKQANLVENSLDYHGTNMSWTAEIWQKGLGQIAGVTDTSK